MALWSAVRALEEQMVLARRILERARKANHTHAVATFQRRMQEAEEHSSIIRQLLLSNKKDDIGEPALQGNN
jgi:hypothetical protein